MAKGHPGFEFRRGRGAGRRRQGGAALALIAFPCLGAALAAQPGSIPNALRAVLEDCEAAASVTIHQATGLVRSFAAACRGEALSTVDDAELQKLVDRCSRLLSGHKWSIEDDFEYYLANELIRRGRLAQAEERLRALEQQDRSGDLPHQRVRRLALLAEIACTNRNYQEALDLLERVEPPQATLDQLQRTEYQLHLQLLNKALATAAGVKAQVLSDLDRTSGAIEQLTRGRGYAEKAGAQDALAQLLEREVDLEMARSKYREAVDKIAAFAASGIELPPTLRLTRGIARWRAAGPEQRQAALQELETIVGDVRPAYLRVPAQIRLFEAALDARDWPTARKWQAQCTASREVADGSSGEAIRFVTLSAQLAREAGEPDEWQQATEKLREATDRLIAQWKRMRIDDLGGGYAHTAPERNAIGELLQCLVGQARGPEPDRYRSAIAVLLRVSACSSLSQAHGCAAGTSTRFRNAVVDPQGGALLFWPSRDRSHLFAIDRHKVTYAELPGEFELRQLAARLRERMLDLSNVTGARRERLGLAALAEARELRRAMLPASVWEKVIGWRSVAVFGLDMLHGVAPEVLPLDALDDGHVPLLGECVGVSTLPALPWATFAHRRAKFTRHDVDLSFAACLSSSAATDKSSLREFPRAAAEFLAQPHADRRSGWFDEQATSAQLLALPRARVVHLLGHGVTRPIGISHGLAMHDATVWHDQLARVRFASGSLCILSVCKGGSERLRRGEGGTTTLGGALLRAGATAVIQSNEDLFLREHLELMRTFYGELYAGARSAVALQQARLKTPATDLVERLLRAKLQLVGIDHAPFAHD